MTQFIQIAIDGPAAAGKSTLAKQIAENYGFTYLDTGAMYRCVAYQVLQNFSAWPNNNAIIRVADETEIRFVNQQIICNKQNITEFIRTQAVSQGASDVAVIKGVRQILVAQQQEYAKATSVVMEGRDIGSVVLPNADLKFYLTADINERALRRKKENGEKDLHDIIIDIQKRDDNDRNRADDPLIIVDDAIVIDNTDKTIEAVYAEMQQHIDLKIKEKADALWHFATHHYASKDFPGAASRSGVLRAEAMSKTTRETYFTASDLIDKMSSEN